MAITFNLYFNGVHEKKFVPKPVNVGFLYTLVVNSLLSLATLTSRKDNPLFEFSFSMVNLILLCLELKYS